MMTMTTMTMVALKGAGFLVAAALANALLGRASASLRHVIWTAALTAIVAVPLFEATGVDIPVPVPAAWLGTTEAVVPAAMDRPARPSAVVHAASAPLDVLPLDVERGSMARPTDSKYAAPEASTAPSIRTRGIRTDRNVATAAGGTTVAGVPSARPSITLGQAGPDRAGSGWSGLSWSSVVAGSWALGALLLLSLTLLGHLAALRLTTRRVRPASDEARERLGLLMSETGVQRPVRLVVSSVLVVPATWGLRTATIVLPELSRTWSRSTLDRVLLHELAHVKRLDCWTQLLGEFARALHWPNPLVWIAAARQRFESERACDDLVLDHGNAASAYADDLVGMLRALKSARPVPQPILTMAAPTGMAARLRAILDPGRRRTPVRRAWVAAAMALTLGLAFSAAGLSPVASAQVRPPEPPPPPSMDVRDPAPAPAADEPMIVEVRVEPVPAPDTPPPPDLVRTLERRPRPDAAYSFEWSAGSVASAATAWVRGSVVLPVMEALSLAPFGQSQEHCVFQNDGRRSSSTNVDDDVIRIRWETNACRVDIDIEGNVEFADDDSGISAMQNGALFEVEERIGSARRRARLESRGGSIQREYWVDGDSEPWGVEADRWLAGLLPQLFRHTTINAPARVRRLLAAGGPAAVFTEVERMRSDHVRGYYLELLMAEADLSGAEYGRVIDVAGSIGSDHTSTELLLAVVERAGMRPAFQGPLLRAADGLESDHQKTRVLQALLRSDLSPQQLDDVVRAARSIESDHNLGQVLSTVASEGRLSDAGRAVFMETLGTIDSDHQHARVLETFLDAGALTDAELTQVLAMMQGIQSDHQKATILSRVAREYELTGPQITAYLRAASEIESDHQMSMSAEAIIGRAEFSAEHLELVLSMAMDIDSDHQRAMVLHSAIERRALSSVEVDRVLAVARELDSDHQLSTTLQLLATDEELDRDGVLGVLVVAGSIDSDHSRATVMTALAQKYAIDGRARDAYIELAEDMSRHQRDQVLAAIVR